ncbi:MAG: hypothetical protein ACRD51_01195 [Candidatus Acidiferrum sp.]
MRLRTRFRLLGAMPILAAIAGVTAGGVCAQELRGSDRQTPLPVQQAPPASAGHLPTSPHQQLATSAVQVCVEPAPMVRLEDYDGPLRKVVGTFVGRLERRTVHQPRYKPGAKLCTFLFKDKVVLFLQDLSDPGTFLAAGFDAGLDQAQDSDPSYGQGAQGYGRRFGAELAGQATSRFFLDFAYPSIFSEDPRYYRMGRGPFGKRLLHALGHSVAAHRDNGNVMFNFSEWLGTASAVTLSNTYHPDNRRGFTPAAERVGYSVLQDVGFDMLREFWPEISQKFRLPFRGESAPVVVKPIPAGQ